MDFNQATGGALSEKYLVNWTKQIWDTGELCAGILCRATNVVIGADGTKL